MLTDGLGTLGPVEISWEWEVLVYFHGNGKDHGNGLVGMHGRELKHYPICRPQQAIIGLLSFYSSLY